MIKIPNEYELVKGEHYYFHFDIDGFINFESQRKQLAEQIKGKLLENNFSEIKTFVYKEHINIQCKYEGILDNQYIKFNPFIVYSVIVIITTLIIALSVHIISNDVYKFVANPIPAGIIIVIIIIVIVIIILKLKQ